MRTERFKKEELIVMLRHASRLLLSIATSELDEIDATPEERRESLAFFYTHVGPIVPFLQADNFLENENYESLIKEAKECALDSALHCRCSVCEVYND